MVSFSLYMMDDARRYFFLNPFYKNLALWCVITLMMIMLYKMFNPQNMTETNPGYSDFLAMVDENRVQQVVIQGQRI